MRTITIDGCEFLILWDGAHAGDDADLFNMVEAPRADDLRRRRIPADPGDDRGRMASQRSSLVASRQGQAA